MTSWWEPLPDAERMRATDAWAIEERDVPSLDLMERAGGGLAALAAEVIPSGPIAVVCGKGNNGGDGYVAARELRAAGREVRVLSTAPLDELRGDAAINCERLLGDPPEPFSAAALHGIAGAIDAVLGTGFSGEPHGVAADAIAALNDTGAPVVAADVPSGVDASTGAIAGIAVRAVATATFHAAKPGLWIHPGKAYAGDVRVVEIGIPDGAPVEPAEIGVITDRVLDGLPRRGPRSTKFSSGHVLLAGGWPGMSGAICLAARAAQRAGAGYVTACVPPATMPVVELAVLEAVKVALPEDGNAQTVLDVAERRGGALVLGCGLGRSDGAVAFARELAVKAPVPLVLDADGLNAHAGQLEALAERDQPTVLTPHAGELGRLLEVDSADVEAARLQHACEAARRSGAIVVLKGDDTLVAAPNGCVAVSAGGAPALATAGTGDVLAGICGAMLAKDLAPFIAVAGAVHRHLLAGRAAATERSAESVIASDVVAAIS
ncbi:MAG TPA: NAD(P)H-hydrate dehydratase [Solirubrobacteraceae bacterium]